MNWRTRWWLGSRFPSVIHSPLEGSRTGVFLLAASDCHFMQELVAALDCEHPNLASPESTVGGSNASTPRVAVFIQPKDGAWPPAAWEGRSGDIVYSSPAAFELLGFVSIDP